MKIICVGRNYAAHARELKHEIPDAPVLFLKPQTALLQPGRPLYYPDFTQDLHYECEMVVRISKNGKHIQERFARKYYDAITVGIDFTARDVQERLKAGGLPWETAKAFDGSAAAGRFVPLSHETDITALGFQLHRNGTLVQEGNTDNMLFRIDTLISYASRFFSLNMGDLFFTGTPAGVGSLAVGDMLEGYLDGQKLLEVSIR